MIKKLIDDPIPFPPQIASDHARVWLVNLTAMRKLTPDTRDATIAIWLIEAAWAHPVWHSYILTLVHLRSEDGIEDPLIYTDGATHEFHLAVADPDVAREQIISGRVQAVRSALQPLNFAAQFGPATDAEAMRRMDDTIRLICDKSLSPDTDFRAAWISLFNSDMVLGATA